MSDIFLSIIIPAYNEAKRLEPTLKRISEYVNAADFPCEVILSDDGSRDGTVEVAKNSSSLFQNFHIIETRPNRGKGHAVKAGMLKAQGDYCLFSDADLSTPIEEWNKFLKHHQEGADVVIGSRSIKGSELIKRQPFFRECMGKVFNGVARLFAFKNIHDSQCGFKSFSKTCKNKIFETQKLEGFSFDVELIFLAQRMGYQVDEVPVKWENSEATKVNVLSDPVKMFLDVMKIRRLHRHESFS